LECGDLSPLWSVATCRDHRWTEVLKDLGVKPPQTKAVTAPLIGFHNLILQGAISLFRFCVFLASCVTGMALAVSSLLVSKAVLKSNES